MNIGQIKVEAFQECGRLATKVKKKAVRSLLSTSITMYKGQLPESQKYKGRSPMLEFIRYLSEKLTVKPFKK